MKIGVGVTTYNRPRHLELWDKQYTYHTKKTGGIEFKKCIETDYPTDRKGIAFRKNECLRFLSDCDYIFLFDDDCFPIKDGWAEFFIEASKASGQHHFMYLKDTPTIKKIGEKDGINIYHNCAGCMMFLTQEVIKKIGAYNPAYGLYGFEHAGYSNRIHKAGLTPLGAYTCPKGAGEYIYSMDLDFHKRNEFQNKVNHIPSMSNELRNIPTYTALNKVIYDNDTLTYIPL